VDIDQLGTENDGRNQCTSLGNQLREGLLKKLWFIVIDSRDTHGDPGVGMTRNRLPKAIPPND